MSKKIRLAKVEDLARIQEIYRPYVEQDDVVVNSEYRVPTIEELKERLVDVPGIGDCFIGTIHSFANKIFKNSNEDYKIYTEEIQDQFMNVQIL